MTEQLMVAEVSGQPFVPLTHASPLCQVPSTDVKTETSEVLYTDTPRLLSSPTYSAMSASPARHSPATASAAAQPAAEVDEKMSAIQPTTPLVWEADTDGTQPADSIADDGHTAAAFAALISPGASCCLYDTRATNALFDCIILNVCQSAGV